MEEVLETNIQFVKSIYRELLKNAVYSIKDDTIKVVEFYINKQQYFIDIKNNVYRICSKMNTAATFSEKLFGNRIGYLKDGTIYIGSLNQCNT